MTSTTFLPNPPHPIYTSAQSDETVKMEHSEVHEKKGIVYLFAFPRSCVKQSPNLSPYALTVESWMRLKQIPYELVETWESSKTTKQIPYIRYNGEYLADSQFIIDFLTKKFNLDPTEGLTDEQRAITVAFQRMLDENTSWTYFLYRYYYHADEYARVFRSSTDDTLAEKLKMEAIKLIKQRADYQGMGRKTEEDVARIAKRDVQTVSKFLGMKPFLMGETMTMIDCVAFSHLSNCLLVKDMDYPHKQVLEKEGSNLFPYLERVKERLWPDWDTLVDMGVFA